MSRNYRLLSREALAAPTTSSDNFIQSLVILIVAIFSTLGTGWIIVSFVAFRNLRTFRHSLILGLAISDCLMAINFLSSSTMNLAGHYIGDPVQTHFCSFNGFMTQVFVIQTDYWVLTIAICTYFILVGHKRAASWTQDHNKLLFAIPWLLSCVWAAIGLGTAGYGNIGAWCWFTSDLVRLLANFVPRWIIIIVMLVMYARLYFVLREAQSRFVTFDDETSGRSSSPNTPRPRVLVSDGLNEQGARRLSGSRTNRRLRRVARQMLLYPIAYMVIWTLPTSVRIYQTVMKRPAPFALQTVDKSCIVIQGFVDAVIYGVNETSLSAWRNLIWPTTYPMLDAALPPEPASMAGKRGGKTTRPKGAVTWDPPSGRERGGGPLRTSESLGSLDGVRPKDGSAAVVLQGDDKPSESGRMADA